MSKLNIGIVGCGRISDLHCPGYEGHPDARIYAVCDTNAELAEQRKLEWAAEKACLDFHDLINDRNIDAVEILTPQKLHESMVLDAAEAGKHIALQKPMTISLESADRMLDAVNRAGVIFRVTDNYLFYPPVVQARKMIEEGAIGNPMNLRIKMIAGGSGGWEVPSSAWAWRASENREGRGFQTFDHGHHLWAVAWYLLGEVERVASWIDSLNGIIDSPAVMMWKYRESVRYGSCEYAYAPQLNIPSQYYANDEWFEITGSRGIIVIPRCTGNILEGPGLSLFDGDRWQHFDSIKTDWREGFIGATHNFIDALKGRAAPLLSGDEAREILRFNLAVSKSARVRREVYLDELDSDNPWLFTKRKIRRELQERKERVKPATTGCDDAEDLSSLRSEVIRLTSGLADRFEAAQHEDWKASIQLALHDGRENDLLLFEFSFDKGTFTLYEVKQNPNPDLVIKLSAFHWRDILEGSYSIEAAFANGDLELDGRIEEGLRLREAFNI